MDLYNKSTATSGEELKQALTAAGDTMITTIIPSVNQHLLVGSRKSI